mmetsp:Transcript_114857/g.335949  ORF Transcript_114857/g.335949 Transcript_114857/m.335949 type:complete len:274 (+) Transcript_114857:287-1108(+)
MGHQTELEDLRRCGIMEQLREDNKELWLQRELAMHTFEKLEQENVAVKQASDIMEYRLENLRRNRTEEVGVLQRRITHLEGELALASKTDPQPHLEAGASCLPSATVGVHPHSKVTLAEEGVRACARETYGGGTLAGEAVALDVDASDFDSANAKVQGVPPLQGGAPTGETAALDTPASDYPYNVKVKIQDIQPQQCTTVSHTIAPDTAVSLPSGSTKAMVQDTWPEQWANMSNAVTRDRIALVALASNRCVACGKTFRCKLELDSHLESDRC